MNAMEFLGCTFIGVPYRPRPPMTFGEWVAMGMFLGFAVAYVYWVQRKT